MKYIIIITVWINTWLDFFWWIRQGCYLYLSSEAKEKILKRLKQIEEQIDKTIIALTLFSKSAEIGVLTIEEFTRVVKEKNVNKLW